MTNNDVLRRLRYIADAGDDQMIALFGLGGKTVTRAEVSDWLKKDSDPAHQVCSDVALATFLNGLIVDRRGRRDGPPLVPEERLNNNLILTKLKIAFSLKSSDLVEILALAGFHVSEHEVTALFRKPRHKHYRPCRDQLLRRFLQGLQTRVRGES